MLESMMLDPTNYRTWNDFKDHPIFSSSKSAIEKWSHDSSRYCELNTYNHFWPDYYVHVDPQPPIEYQVQVAQRDIFNLATVCNEIENRFGVIIYELVILDDFTAYVWISHRNFAIEIYPTMPDDDGILKLFIDRPEIHSSEHSCSSAHILVETLAELLGTELKD
jgi:hypothetical protein